MNKSFRQLGNQTGYTLVELVVGVALMGVIFAVVTQLFQISLTVQARGNTTEEALSQARTPLTQLAHDLQHAGAGFAAATGVFTQATATSFVFLGDLDDLETTLTAAAAIGATSLRVASTNGLAVGKVLLVSDGPVRENLTLSGISGSTLTVSGALVNSYPTGSAVRSVESVTYTFASPTLSRSQDGGASADMADNLSTFAFIYQDGSTPPITLAPTTQAIRDQIRQVTVQLSGQGTGAQPAIRNFQLVARPRNLP
ncbi:MAG TPA: type II secretion system protein [Methylomirabilota bacterium]|nr:type II secretion system protein [Methylomirabilota bacterium]